MIPDLRDEDGAAECGGQLRVVKTMRVAGTWVPGLEVLRWAHDGSFLMIQV